MRSRSFNSQPGGGGHVSHENDLENLGSHLLRPEPVVTPPPTTVEPIPPTTVKPGKAKQNIYVVPITRQKRIG